MGKYDDVVDNLDRLPAYLQEEPNYQNKVEGKKKEIYAEIGEALSSASLANLYKEARKQKDFIEKELYDANLELNAITQMMTDRYEIDGISSLKLDTGEKVEIRYEPYAVVEDKQKVWQWCKDNGYEREMQVHWNTLNSITKERLLQGEPEPDGIRAYTKVKAVFTKA